MVMDQRQSFSLDKEELPPLVVYYQEVGEPLQKVLLLVHLQWVGVELVEVV